MAVLKGFSNPKDRPNEDITCLVRMGCHKVNHPCGRRFVKQLLTFDKVESTSDLAAELIQKGDVELPLAVWAKNQTRGRGRADHIWWSDSGSLTFTLGIDPSAHRLTAASEPKLALATAVAIIDALIELGVAKTTLGIRWPNDIEADGRKLGGVLPERLDTDWGHRILIGIGLNIVSDLKEAPDQIRQMATNLRMIGQPISHEWSLGEIFEEILRHFESVLGRLVDNDPTLAERWNELDLLRDRWVRVQQGSRIISGRGCGIFPDGSFCLHIGVEELQIFGGQILRP